MYGVNELITLILVMIQGLIGIAILSAILYIIIRVARSVALYFDKFDMATKWDVAMWKYRAKELGLQLDEEVKDWKKELEDKLKDKKSSK